MIMACMTGFLAMAIDLMLPALQVIGHDLGVEHSNDVQWIIISVFAGVAIGQLIYGPLSDAKGRKPAVYLGFSIFIVGTVISLVSTSLEVMLLGRLLQGFGLAGPRIVTMAIVRDQFEGPQMARVMSLVMATFLTVPIIAPIIGQEILLTFGWRMIFGVLLIIAVTIFCWFALRFPETLLVEKRKRFTWSELLSGIKEISLNKVAISYTVSLGMVFGAFLGFISSIPQAFQELYGLGESFPFYFAALATGVGMASFLNSKLVMFFGMKGIVIKSQIVSALLSLAALICCYWLSSVPPLWFVMVYFFVIMIPTGLLFGNLSTLALSGFGDIAGVASSFVGVVSMLLSVIFGTIVGQSYNETIIPLIVGFFLLSSASYVITRYGT